MLNVTLITVALCLPGADPFERIEATGTISNVEGVNCFPYLLQTFHFDAAHNPGDLAFTSLTIGDEVVWDYDTLGFWDSSGTWDEEGVRYPRSGADLRINSEGGMVRPHSADLDSIWCRLTVQQWTSYNRYELVPGDVNVDGQFNSSDLVVMFQAGEYEDGAWRNSRWNEGDYTFDREFDTSDLVLMFREGNYVTDAAVPVPEPESMAWMWLGVIVTWLRKRDCP